MHRSFSTLAVAVALPALLAVCADDEGRTTAETALGSPRLEVSPATIDLGAVPVGQWVTATFLLRNTGHAPLRFTDAPWVKAVAGC